MDVTFHVLDVRKLIMLQAVMAEGSIAAAARRLQYTRSAVSQQISALEAEAGAALIDRAGNHITLTPAGRALVEHAERILVELRSAEATLAGAGSPISGLLRVGIPFREGPHIMSRALGEVRGRFPDMESRLGAISDREGRDAGAPGNGCWGMTRCGCAGPWGTRWRALPRARSANWRPSHG